MFTGIITGIGRVASIEDRGDLRVVITTDFNVAEIDDGASIACSGACLTVVDRGDAWFAVDVSKETLDCTNLRQWTEGTRVNLERSLRLGDELGGHIVSGHVDGIATLKDLRKDGNSFRLFFDVPSNLSKFIASKGSVALDGISLTVNEVSGNSFGVNIIPHTWENTTLDEAASGTLLNLEIDMLARYVARLTQQMEAVRYGAT